MGPQPRVLNLNLTLAQWHVVLLGGGGIWQDLIRSPRPLAIQKHTRQQLGEIVEVWRDPEPKRQVA